MPSTPLLLHLIPCHFIPFTRVFFPPNPAFCCPPPPYILHCGKKFSYNLQDDPFAGTNFAITPLTGIRFEIQQELLFTLRTHFSPHNLYYIFSLFSSADEKFLLPARCQLPTCPIKHQENQIMSIFNRELLTLMNNKCFISVNFLFLMPPARLGGKLPAYFTCPRASPVKCDYC